MDKAQAIQSFWSSFGLKAYDENTVPTGNDAPDFPYITYNFSEDFFGTELSQSVSIWYRSPSWGPITNKSKEIADRIGYGGTLISYEGGAAWIRRGTPFSQRMSEPSDDMVRRILINIEIEYISAD